jgi:hypothetical protein
LSQRKDIKARLKYLMQSLQYPPAIGEEKLQAISKLSYDENESFQVSLRGSTFLSVFDT